MLKVFLVSSVVDFANFHFEKKTLSMEQQNKRFLKKIMLIKGYYFYNQNII